MPQIPGGGSGNATFDPSVSNSPITRVTLVDEAGQPAGASISAGDINIGAVEIKDGDSTAHVTVKADNAAAGTPVAMAVGAQYQASDQTYTSGDLTVLQSDISGFLRMREQYAPSYEDNVVGVAKVEQRFSNTYISTATTTTVKSGAGHLHSITCNGGTAGTIIVYDNTAASGTIIASFDSTNALATYMFNCSFSTGLTIITGAATKLSVSWR